MTSHSKNAMDAGMEQKLLELWNYAIRSTTSFDGFKDLATRIVAESLQKEIANLQMSILELQDDKRGLIELAKVRM